MKLALLSDIHGNLHALQAVLEDIGRRGVDQIVNLGDSLSGPLLPLETAELLMRQPWIQLAGNHERQVLEIPPERQSASDRYAHSQLTPAALDWMRSLPPTATIGDEILLCHGTPTSDLQYFLETLDPGGVRAATLTEVTTRLGPTPARFIACGHTHTPRVVRTRQGQLIVNPGSVGLPAFDASQPFPHVVQTCAPDAHYAIVEKLQPRGDWCAALLTVPYDFQAAAELARKRGRPEWEEALLTGYLPGPGVLQAPVSQ